MTKSFKDTRLGIGIFFACLALFAAFICTALVAAPAYAMASKPVIKVATVDPATLTPARDKAYADYNAFSQCVFQKPGQAAARSANEFSTVETSLNTLGIAAKAGNKDAFDSEVAFFYSTLNALKAKWGC